jgi:hypothetical protein
MNCGTYQLSLEASAARPDVARGSYLHLDGMWNAKPAATVATTDRHLPRPLERSP